MTEKTIAELHDACPAKNRHVVFQIRLREAAHGLKPGVMAYSGRPGRVIFPSSDRVGRHPREATGSLRKLVREKTRAGWTGRPFRLRNARSTRTCCRPC